MRGMWRAFLILTLVFVLTSGILSACAAREIPLPHNAPAPVTRSLDVGPAEAVSQYASEETTVPDVSRRIIYEADLELVVQDAKKAAQEIGKMAEALGGYVAEAHLYRNEGVLTGNMTIRVPQEQFQEALDRLHRLAVRVDRESLRTNDVTQQYVDLQARLKNLEATEEELRALLHEVREENKNASDIIEVYRELTRIRSEIEQIKGRLRVLDTLTTLATIRITLTPYELSRPLSNPWDPRVTFYEAWRTLLKGVRFLINAAIYLVVVVLPLAILTLFPVALLILLLRWGFWRLRKISPVKKVEE